MGSQNNLKKGKTKLKISSQEKQFFYVQYISRDLHNTEKGSDLKRKKKDEGDSKKRTLCPLNNPLGLPHNPFSSLHESL